MLSIAEISIRLALAAAFGAAIGLERERKDWTAGLRTHMMVCMGSSLIMMVSSFGFQDIINHPHVSLDPSRVAAQVVSGIGFIGAGTIMFLKPSTVLGLTTASGLWTVAAIGLATGGGMYYAASIATVFALFILWALQPLQKRVSRKYQQRFLTITIAADTNPSVIINTLTENKNAEYYNFTVSRNRKETVIELKLDSQANQQLMQIVEGLNTDPNVKKISWTH
ncbi:magnesium transporter MgtC [Flavobacterium rivuli WB 3.3-2 = DSM 21788]|uniref:Magnesium transporter MgtC n=1 Tax=Flavobacterium rivuli WB 3.3-2 = DSM 21788 TaxID=1121895 RepID=A0A0A2M6Y8_9FLAO|nr:MgtC/SapB family protein [Flavobacterium rivuli]KGO87401.1 magnesium transporter MgtC [Flavobacterium rivuli WB 3.3-2 = DSM 21788]